MKQFLYIIGFIIAILLFVDNEEQQAFLSDFRPKSETIMKETLAKNREQCLVVLSEDLKTGIYKHHAEFSNHLLLISMCESSRIVKSKSNISN